MGAGTGKAEDGGSWGSKKVDSLRHLNSVVADFSSKGDEPREALHAHCVISCKAWPKKSEDVKHGFDVTVQKKRHIVV